MGVVIGAALLVLGGWAVHAVGRAAATGRLAPNWAAGLRTRTIMTDEETWRAGHQAGLDQLRTAAWGVTLLGAVAVYAALAVRAESAFVLLLAGAAALLTGVIQAAVKGQRAACEVLAARRQ